MTPGRDGGPPSPASDAGRATADEARPAPGTPRADAGRGAARAAERRPADAERGGPEAEARRHHTAAARDVVADERDRVADLRDSATSDVDAELLAADPNNAPLREALTAHAVLRDLVRADRDEAALDRRRAAEDRVQAARNRRASGDDAAPGAGRRADGTDADSQLAGARIANRLVGLHKQHRGRGPQTVHVQCLEDMVTVVMRDDYSRTETELSAAGHADSVDDQRRLYEQMMKPRLIEVTEQELGRSVDAFMSASHHEPDLTIEVFVLQRR